MIEAPASLLQVPMWRELVDQAREVAQHAYNPYSGHLVGAAMRTRSGRVFRGTFLENASYGLTVCAEVVAVANANSNGCRDLHAIAIVGGDPSRSDGEPCTPCGRCRQVISEVGSVHGLNPLVLCSNLSISRLWLTTASELLPSAWGLPAPVLQPSSRESESL